MKKSRAARKSKSGRVVQVDEPIEVIPMGHTETRIFARKIRESWCAKKGCRFYGKHAVQGVCHTTRSFAGDDYSYWEHLEVLVGNHVTHLREKILAKMTPKERERRLLSEVSCALMNAWGTLDECVRLRRDNAILQDKLLAARATSKARWRRLVDTRREVTQAKRESSSKGRRS